MHFDVAGLFRTFKASTWLLQLPMQPHRGEHDHDTIHGGGVEGGANVEL